MKRENLIPLIASLGIIWIIHRSFVKLSGTFHRLLLGLCMVDILSSLAQTPQSDDVIWNARRNAASCSAQGVYISLDSVAAPLYKCFLCVYYLIDVT